MGLFPLADQELGRMSQKILEQPFQCGYALTTVLDQITVCESFNDPLSKPGQLVRPGYIWVKCSKEYTTILAFKALFAILPSPFYRIKKTAGPTTLFLKFSSTNKSLMKLVSLNSHQLLDTKGSERNLPTIFDHYTIGAKLLNAVY